MVDIMAASTPMSVLKPTTTTTKPSQIPVMVYNLAQGKFQEIPKLTRRLQEEEIPLTPNGHNPPMVQQPKAATIATSTGPLTRDDTPWPNTMPSSTNLFVARASWPNPPNMDDVPTPTFVKTEKTEEMTPPKQAAIPCALILHKSQNSKPAEEACG